MSAFLNDVLLGLKKLNKTLPSRYFYDEIGDALFIEIMNMPEYYLTRAEMDIFKNKTAQLVQAMGFEKDQEFELIELGAGDGSKTEHLLRYLVNHNYRFTYKPVDISSHSLNDLQTRLAHQLPALKMEPLCGDYFRMLQSVTGNSTPKVVLFLGSNIGNMADEVASDFLLNLSNELMPKDQLILGVDLIKPKEVVLPAYHDKGGITAAFNLNLLTRINTELGANFEGNQFMHFAEYEESEGISKSFLKSLKKQSIVFPETGDVIAFEEGELIHTEISRKYSDKILMNILEKTPWRIKNKLQDTGKLFADYVLIKEG
ncbi:MAG: L-histidine N-alpha-methyltransferase [Luteibaculaceae bacterium]|jgi:L-histidine N-alpha-methyltransferase